MATIRHYRCVADRALSFDWGQMGPGDEHDLDVVVADPLVKAGLLVDVTPTIPNPGPAKKGPGTNPPAVPLPTPDKSTVKTAPAGNAKAAAEPQEPTK